MTSPDSKPTTKPSVAGSDLRQGVESLGSRLSESLRETLSQLPRRAVGPQILAKTVGTTTVTASRLLKALRQQDPVSVLQLLPGPNPLRQVIEGARSAGVPNPQCDSSLLVIEEFDELIRIKAGDRSALKAMLSAWLPDERGEFEAQRRQTIYKAMAELDGVSCEFGLTSLILNPSGDGVHLDVNNIEVLLGIDRIRPDAEVVLGTRALLSSKEDVQQAAGTSTASEDRRPLNLDGDVATDGFHTVRLDEFCDAPPAPLVTEVFGQSVQHSLGPTGFGPSSTVDLIIAELNPSELVDTPPKKDGFMPYFFAIPEIPTRRQVMDVLIHKDVYPGSTPELVVYETATRGPAQAGDPRRRVDLRPMTEAVEDLGMGFGNLWLAEFPRYRELQTRVFEKLEIDPNEFKLYRINISYPVAGRQLTMVFRP